MKGKILFVAGLAAGYVVGARAGRQSYDKLKNRAENVWHDPAVQKGVHKAEDFVAENAPIAGKKIAEGAQNAVHAAGEKISSSKNDSESTTP